MNSLIETKEICSFLGITHNVETLKRYMQQYPDMPVKKFGGRYKADPDILQEYIRTFLSAPKQPSFVSATKPQTRKGSKTSFSATIPPPGGWQIKKRSEWDD